MGAGAHHVIEIAADQQEEKEHDGGIEIGLLAVLHRLVEAHAAGQDHGQRDRHVHIEAARAERGEGGAEERPPGENDGGGRDQGGQPVKQDAGRVIGAGPDRDRQQHHIARGESGNAQREQKLAAALPVRGVHSALGVERAHVEAKVRNHPRQSGGFGFALVPVHRDALGRHVDPGADHAAAGFERGFDALDAAGAVHAVDHEVEMHAARRGFMCPERIVGLDEARRTAWRCGDPRPGCAGMAGHVSPPPSR